MDVNDRLLAVLKAAGVTHAELAEGAGMSTRQVTRILSKDSVPSPDTVQRWCVSQGLDPCVAMADSPSMLDLVIIMMSALNEDEMRFVCKYVDELHGGVKQDSS